MHADDAAGVSPGRPGLLTEAGGEGAVAQRQLAGVENLVAMDVGERDLGRGDQVHALGRGFEQVLLKLGELRGAQQGVAVDDDGRPPFLKAALQVRVDKERDERPLEHGAQAAEQHKARAGELGGPLHVEDAQSRAQVPVRLGLKVPLARCAPATGLGVLGIILAQGHGVVYQVGTGHQQPMELLCQLALPGVELGYLIL